jgi:hypothetical protein
MSDTPTVLVLVANADRREGLRRRLVGLDVRPIDVRTDHAADAVELYQPISVLIDDASATDASDDFLETTCMHHVRLVSLCDADSHEIDASIQNAVSPRPAA